jgi:hypothetical protein
MQFDYFSNIHTFYIRIPLSHIYVTLLLEYFLDHIALL